MSAPPRRRARWLVVLLLVVAGVAAWETSDLGRRGSALLSQPTAGVRMLGSARLRRALVRARLISLRPADPGAPVSADRFAPCPDLRFAAGRHPVPALRPPLVERGVPVLALALDPCRLDRLDRNRWQRGRRFEQVGWVAYYERGRLLFETAVGVRVHGGRSRSRGPMEVRLYFRESYGAPGFPAAYIGDEPAAPIRRLVVRHEARSDRDLDLVAPWVSPITFAIARRTGGLAAGARPVRYVLGGSEPQTYVLIPHLGEDFVERRFGHRDFDLVRGKDRQDKPALAWAERERRWLEDAGTDQLAGVASNYDFESFTTWFVPILFCEVGDTFQAVLLRDRRGEVAGGRWFLVHWDMDQSFRIGIQRPPPTRLLAGLLGRHVDREYGAIWELLRWRFRADPAFPRQLAERFAFTVNHRLTAGYLDGLVAENVRTADELGISADRFFTYLRSFFRDRREHALGQILKQLGLGAPHTVAVSAPAGAVRVDGETLAGEYSGRYVPGSELRLAAAPGVDARRLAWRVDGRPLDDVPGELRLRVDRPLRVEARFSDSRAGDSRR